MDKKKLAEANEKADTIVDGVLFQVSQSKYSAVLVGVALLVAFGLGVYLGAKF